MPAQITLDIPFPLRIESEFETDLVIVGSGFLATTVADTGSSMDPGGASYRADVAVAFGAAMGPLEVLFTACVVFFPTSLLLENAKIVKVITVPN